jgi:hypothetical protein
VSVPLAPLKGDVAGFPTVHECGAFPPQNDAVVEPEAVTALVAENNVLRAMQQVVKGLQGNNIRVEVDPAVAL